MTAMLKEECGAFAVDDNDIGCARELELEINLKDDKLVQKTYNSIPKPLYGEVKTHLQDMISHGWIITSKSPYSSPVVCVRKKDGSLRLCVDYRQLNSKTQNDRQPIPPIQDIRNNLSGNAYFSVLEKRESLSSGIRSGRTLPFNSIHHTLGAVPIEPHTIWIEKCPSPLPEVYGELLGGLAGLDMYFLS